LKKGSKFWRAYIGTAHLGTRKWLGRFATEVEAARAYDSEAKRIYGEFANLNFPDATPTPNI